jgi:hypothetical protein
MYKHKLKSSLIQYGNTLGQPCQTQFFHGATLLDKAKLKGRISKCKGFLITAIFWNEGLPYIALINGSLLPWHGAFSGCRWRNGLQIWRVAVNILNKQLQTADNWWSSAWGLGEALTPPYHKKLIMLRNIARSLRIRLIVQYNPSNGKGI